MASLGGEYTVTGSAVNLTTALSLSNPVYAQNIDILALGTNTGAVAIGGSAVTTSANRRGQLSPGQAWTSGPVDNHPINTNEIYLIGPGTSEKVLIHILS